MERVRGVGRDTGSPQREKTGSGGWCYLYDINMKVSVK